jgi:hypothetical protein
MLCMQMKNESTLYEMSQNIPNLVLSDDSSKNKDAFMINLGKICLKIEKLEFEDTPDYERLIKYVNKCKSYIF